MVSHKHKQVLDENKKLCLVSGEIITMTNWMRMVFEVEDLSVPSSSPKLTNLYRTPSITTYEKSRTSRGGKAFWIFPANLCILR